MMHMKHKWPDMQELESITQRKQYVPTALRDAQVQRIASKI